MLRPYYTCPDCGAQSSPEDWTKQTAEMIGYAPNEGCPMDRAVVNQRDSVYFHCPLCGEDNFIQDIIAKTEFSLEEIEEKMEKIAQHYSAILQEVDGLKYRAYGTLFDEAVKSFNENLGTDLNGHNFSLTCFIKECRATALRVVDNLKSQEEEDLD